MEAKVICNIESCRRNVETGRKAMEMNWLWEQTLGLFDSLGYTIFKRLSWCWFRSVKSFVVCFFISSLLRCSILTFLENIREYAFHSASLYLASYFGSILLKASIFYSAYFIPQFSTVSLVVTIINHKNSAYAYRHLYAHF